MSRYTKEDVGRICASIAASMQEPVLWIRALDELCQVMGNVRAIFNPIYPTPESWGLAFPSSNWDPAHPAFDLFPRRIYREDVNYWTKVNKIPERGSIIALQGSEQDVRNSEMYVEWLEPLGLAPDPGLLLSFGKRGNLPTGGLGIYREAGRRQFDEEDISLIEALAPIFLVAEQLHGLPGLLSEEIEDRSGPAEIGVAKLDANGRVIRCNAVLESMIAAGRMRLVDGTLHMDEPDLAYLLTWAVQQALNRRSLPQQAEPLEFSPPTLHGSTCRLKLLALPFDAGEMRVMVLIRNLATAAPSLEATLIEVFGLNPSQAQVAWLRANGLPDKEIARRMGKENGRMHVERIYEKLGVHKKVGESGAAAVAAFTRRVLTIATFLAVHPDVQATPS